jgi:hypothetical protein
MDEVLNEKILRVKKLEENIIPIVNLNSGIDITTDPRNPRASFPYNLTPFLKDISREDFEMEFK